jgi:hypothetical protein
MLDTNLYRQTIDSLLLKCLGSDQSKIAMGKVYEDIYGTHCDRTTSKMKGLSHKIISGDSRRSENAQTHTNKHTIPNMKFKLNLLQIKCHVLGFTKR